MQTPHTGHPADVRGQLPSFPPIIPESDIYVADAPAELYRLSARPKEAFKFDCPPSSAVLVYNPAKEQYELGPLGQVMRSVHEVAAPIVAENVRLLSLNAMLSRISSSGIQLVIMPRAGDEGSVGEAADTAHPGGPLVGLSRDYAALGFAYSAAVKAYYCREAWALAREADSLVQRAQAATVQVTSAVERGPRGAVLAQGERALGDAVAAMDATTVQLALYVKHWLAVQAIPHIAYPATYFLASFASPHAHQHRRKHGHSTSTRGTGGAAGSSNSAAAPGGTGAPSEGGVGASWDFQEDQVAAARSAMARSLMEALHAVERLLAAHADNADAYGGINDDIQSVSNNSSSSSTAAVAASAASIAANTAPLPLSLPTSTFPSPSPTMSATPSAPSPAAARLASLLLAIAKFRGICLDAVCAAGMHADPPPSPATSVSISAVDRQGSDAPDRQSDSIMDRQGDSILDRQGAKGSGGRATHDGASRRDFAVTDASAGSAAAAPARGYLLRVCSCINNGGWCPTHPRCLSSSSAACLASVTDSEGSSRDESLSQGGPHGAHKPGYTRTRPQSQNRGWSQLEGAESAATWQRQKASAGGKGGAGSIGSSGGRSVASGEEDRIGSPSQGGGHPEGDWAPDMVPLLARFARARARRMVAVLLGKGTSGRSTWGGSGGRRTVDAAPDLRGDGMADGAIGSVDAGGGGAGSLDFAQMNGGEAAGGVFIGGGLSDGGGVNAGAGQAGHDGDGAGEHRQKGREDGREREGKGGQNEEEDPSEDEAGWLALEQLCLRELSVMAAVLPYCRDVGWMDGARAHAFASREEFLCALAVASGERGGGREGGVYDTSGGVPLLGSGPALTHGVGIISSGTASASGHHSAGSGPASGHYVADVSDYNTAGSSGPASGMASPLFSGNNSGSDGTRLVYGSSGGSDSDDMIEPRARPQRPLVRSMLSQQPLAHATRVPSTSPPATARVMSAGTDNSGGGAGESSSRGGWWESLMLYVHMVVQQHVRASVACPAWPAFPSEPSGETGRAKSGVLPAGKAGRGGAVVLTVQGTNGGANESGGTGAEGRPEVPAGALVPGLYPGGPLPGSGQSVAGDAVAGASMAMPHQASCGCQSSEGGQLSRMERAWAGHQARMLTLLRKERFVMPPPASPPPPPAGEAHSDIGQHGLVGGALPAVSVAGRPPAPTPFRSVSASEAVSALEGLWRAVAQEPAPSGDVGAIVGPGAVPSGDVREDGGGWGAARDHGDAEGPCAEIVLLAVSLANRTGAAVTNWGHRQLSMYPTGRTMQQLTVLLSDLVAVESSLLSLHEAAASCLALERGGGRPQGPRPCPRPYQRETAGEHASLPRDVPPLPSSLAGPQAVAEPGWVPEQGGHSRPPSAPSQMDESPRGGGGSRGSRRGASPGANGGKRGQGREQMGVDGKQGRRGEGGRRCPGWDGLFAYLQLDNDLDNLAKVESDLHLCIALLTDMLVSEISSAARNIWASAPTSWSSSAPPSSPASKGTLAVISSLVLPLGKVLLRLSLQTWATLLPAVTSASIHSLLGHVSSGGTFPVRSVTPNGAAQLSRDVAHLKDQLGPFFLHPQASACAACLAQRPPSAPANMETASVTGGSSGSATPVESQPVVAGRSSPFPPGLTATASLVSDANIPGRTSSWVSHASGWEAGTSPGAGPRRLAHARFCPMRSCDAVFQRANAACAILNGSGQGRGDNVAPLRGKKQTGLVLPRDERSVLPDADMWARVRK